MLVINENIEPLVEEYDYIYEFDENILFGANTLKNGKVESDIFTSNGQMITTKKYEMVCNSNMYIDKDEWSGELWSGFWVMDQYYEYFMEEE